MSEQDLNPRLILPVGTKVVVKPDTYAPHNKLMHRGGALAVVIQSPIDHEHNYRVRFGDGFEASFKRADLAVLSHWQNAPTEGAASLVEFGLEKYVILKVVVGSRAYGLDNADSDTDRRGVYLPPASLHWSLYGVPEQLESDATQEVYWELQKFLVLALKCNPTILEVLYSPVVEHASPLALELLALRDEFLSKLAFQTYSGYIASQFKKMETDLRAHGKVKWKHAMHLIRLLYCGVDMMREGTLRLRADEHREKLMRIRNGELSWSEVESLRASLAREFEEAYAVTKLPERPAYEAVDRFLVRARRSVVDV